MDKYNQIVTSDSNSKLTMTVGSSSSTNGAYPPTAEGTFLFYSSQGIFKVNGIKFTATPGQKYKISFATDGID